MAAYGTPKVCKCGSTDFSPKGKVCRSCATEAARAWSKAHPERNRRTWRNSQYKIKYGITLEEYEGMAWLQDNACAICGTDPSPKLLDVDHDHETGKVRGLLCNKCNTALGRLGDTTDSIRRVLNYMEMV